MDMKIELKIDTLMHYDQVTKYCKPQRMFVHNSFCGN